MIRAVIPLRNFDVESALGLVRRIRKKNHEAYLSHRKKQLEKMEWEK